MMVWAGIGACLCLSAVFSGLTIGYFGLSRLRLEVAAETQNEAALKILSLRKDAHFLLTTLLWGNISVNVLLTILTDSIFTGIQAFFFSTIIITLIGEIFPQAFFSRFALQVGSHLVPLIRLCQWIYFPVAKPSAKLLDFILGQESIILFHEKEMKILLKKHFTAARSDISQLEGTGAANFLSLDDIPVKDEGERVDPGSVIELPSLKGLPIFPAIEKQSSDPFLQKLHSSLKKWVIITDETGKPSLVLDADGFLRHALYEEGTPRPYLFCHRPIVVTSPLTKLGEVIQKFKVVCERAGDDVIDQDLILYWSEEKRIITGADILGRLFRGVVGPSKESSV